MSKEKIMVCVSYGPSVEQLIQRGVSLSQKFHSPLYVLYVSKVPQEELNIEQEQLISLWQTQAEQVGAKFIYQFSHDQKPEKVIAETAQAYGITQIIIGQSLQTRWEVILDGCFATRLMNHLGEIDLHILRVAHKEVK